MVSTLFSVLHLPALIAWLEKFKAWLGEKLDALTGGGDLVIDGDVDLTYTDEDGENKSISVLGIKALGKAGFQESRPELTFTVRQ